MYKAGWVQGMIKFIWKASFLISKKWGKLPVHLPSGKYYLLGKKNKGIHFSAWVRWMTIWYLGWLYWPLFPMLKYIFLAIWEGLPMKEIKYLRKPRLRSGKQITEIIKHYERLCPLLNRTTHGWYHQRSAFRKNKWHGFSEMWYTQGVIPLDCAFYHTGTCIQFVR